MANPRRLLHVLPLLALAIACKTDEGSEGVSEDQAAEVGAELMCNAFFECSCDDIVDTFSSEEDCRLELQAGLQEQIDAGKEAELTYNPACIGDLSALLEALGCSGLTDYFFGEGAEEITQYDECKLYYGDGAAGDDCDVLTHDGDPFADTCERDLACIDDRCEAKPSDQLQEEGQPCDPGAPENECQAGLICVPADGAEYTCEILPSAGETCLGTANLCAVGHYCDIEAKDCLVLPGEGEPCAQPPGLLNQQCETGLACNADETCEPGPGPGDACTVFGTCPEGYACIDLVCEQDSPLICLVQ